MRADAQIGVQRGERVIGDLRLGRRHRGKEGRLAGIGQADKPGIGDQLQPEPYPALDARQARIGAAAARGWWTT